MYYVAPTTPTFHCVGVLAFSEIYLMLDAKSTSWHLCRKPLISLFLACIVWLSFLISSSLEWNICIRDITMTYWINTTNIIKARDVLSMSSWLIYIHYYIHSDLYPSAFHDNSISLQLLFLKLFRVHDYIDMPRVLYHWYLFLMML